MILRQISKLNQGKEQPFIIQYFARNICLRCEYARMKYENILVKMVPNKYWQYCKILF